MITNSCNCWGVILGVWFAHYWLRRWKYVIISLSHTIVMVREFLKLKIGCQNASHYLFILKLPRFFIYQPTLFWMNSIIIIIIINYFIYQLILKFTNKFFLLTDHKDSFIISSSSLLSRINVSIVGCYSFLRNKNPLFSHKISSVYVCKGRSQRLESQSLPPTPHQHLYLQSDYCTKGVR